MNLEELNGLDEGHALGELLHCCGSTAWAEAVLQQRPFSAVGSLLRSVEAAWEELDEEDWMEAFRAHPRIGETRAEVSREGSSEGWSSQEQAGASAAGADVKRRIALGNRQYEERFGFLYLVCASGKSGEELLAILEDRLTQEPGRELEVAAGEQQKITRLRLGKLLRSRLS